MAYSSWSSRNAPKKSSRSRQSSSKLTQINFNGGLVVSPYTRGNAWPKGRSPLREKYERRKSQNMFVRGENQTARRSAFDSRKSQRSKREKQRAQSRPRSISLAMATPSRRSPDLLISPVSAPNSDHIYFVSDPQYPGIPVLYRRKDHSVNQERLNLDRRNLTQCPILRGEERLRLLNFENNQIRQISNLQGLPNLIFLDLYNNEIQMIKGLDCITTLRVLMLGRNRIREIEGLDYLNRLDVLDLHGNQISVIHNLNHLTQLRVLNLADNMIQNIENLEGLTALVELNCRRNRVKDVSGLSAVSSLERLFLSDNLISDMECLDQLCPLTNLLELSLDGNPVADQPNYRLLIVLRAQPNLQHLDLKKISTEERNRAAILATHLAQDQSALTSKIARSPSRPVLTPLLSSPTGQIQPPENILKQIHSSNSEINIFETAKALASPPQPQTEEEILHHIEAQWSMENENESQSPESSVAASTQINVKPQTHPPKPVSHYTYNSTKKNIQISGSWNPTDTSLEELVEINFSYIDYNSISDHFPLIKKSCPKLRTMKFSYNNIHCLYQIDALAIISHIQNLTLGKNGTENPIVECNIHRLYCVFRFPNLKTLGGIQVEQQERTEAKQLFGTLKTLWKNPDILRTRGWCSPNLSRPRRLRKDVQLIDNLYRSEFVDPKVQSVKSTIQETLKQIEVSRKIRERWPLMLQKFVGESLEEFQRLSST